MSFRTRPNDTLEIVKSSKKNNKVDRLKSLILDLLAENNPNGLTFKGILQKLPARYAHRSNVKKEIGQLLSERLINRKGKGYRINLKHKVSEQKHHRETLEGYVQKQKSGTLIIPISDKLIKVYPENTKGALASDKVRLQITQRRNNGTLIGRVIKILERGTSKVLFKKAKGKLVPHAPLPLPLILSPRHKKKKLEENCWYFAEPTEKISSEYIEIDVLEKASDRYDLDAQSLLAQYSIPIEFPSKVIDSIDHNPAELCERLDITDQVCFTIDGATAKDFDDAISIHKQGNDFKLGVHIADVSHFVRPNNSLDECARDRGTSLYFPRLVIPMLPEELSNNLCSLVPNQDRHSMTCEMLFSANGHLKKAWFFPSKIRSRQRFTYEQVQAIYEGEISHRYESQIKDCFELYKLLWSQRLKRGTIDFDLPEPQIMLDENYNVESISPLERVDAHKMIEEFMIAANVSMAKFCAQQCITTPFRYHGKPRAEGVEELRLILSSVGINIGQLDLNSPKTYQSILSRCKEEVKPFIQPLILRSMQQAVYSVENSEHFGLALEYYCHFTSPIRRYPDLIVHRQMRQFIIDNNLKLPFPIHPYKLGYRKKLQNPKLSRASQIAQKSSQLERRAVELERDYQQRKKVTFMQQFINREFSVRVSGIIKSGVFACITEYGVEGFIALSELPGYWEFNEQRSEFSQKPRGQNRLRPGDVLEICVAKADKDESRIDFRLSENQWAIFNETRRSTGKRK